MVWVDFPEEGINTLHNMYADDSSMVLRLCTHIRELCLTLVKYGTASCLYCAWENTTTSFIPPGLPFSLWMVPWTWENDEAATKLLGIPIARSIHFHGALGTFSLHQDNFAPLTKLSISSDKTFRWEGWGAGSSFCYVWQYLVHAARLLSIWLPFLDQGTPTTTFILFKKRNPLAYSLVSPTTRLQSQEDHCQHSPTQAHGLPRYLETMWSLSWLHMQYCRILDTPLWNSSSSQLRRLQQAARARICSLCSCKMGSSTRGGGHGACWCLNSYLDTLNSWEYNHSYGRLCIGWLPHSTSVS